MGEKLSTHEPFDDYVDTVEKYARLLFKAWEKWGVADHDGVVVLADGTPGKYNLIKASAARAVFYNLPITVLGISKPSIPNGEADEASRKIFGEGVADEVEQKGETRVLPGNVVEAPLSSELAEQGIEHPLLVLSGNLSQILSQFKKERWGDGYENFKEWVQGQGFDTILIDLTYTQNGKKINTSPNEKLSLEHMIDTFGGNWEFWELRESHVYLAFRKDEF